MRGPCASPDARAVSETVDGAKTDRYAPAAMKAEGARWSFSAWFACALAACGGSTFSGSEPLDAAGPTENEVGTKDSGAAEHEDDRSVAVSDSPALPIDAANEVGRPPDAALAYRGAVLGDAPIAYWRMGIASGSVVPDESGHRNDLLLQGTGHTFGVAGALAGDPDGAIGFDGANGHAVALRPRDFDFPSGAPFTVECWARRERTIDGGSGEYFQHLVSASAGGPPNRNGYIFYILPSDVDPSVVHTAFEYGVLDGVQVGVEGPLGAASSYVHYVATFDGTKISLYVNATLASSRPVNGAFAPRMSEFVVGREASTGRYHFSGALDEIAVYDKALSLLQVTNHRDLALRR
jgi:hypothetical protein